MLLSSSAAADRGYEPLGDITGTRRRQLALQISVLGGMAGFLPPDGSAAHVGTLNSFGVILPVCTATAPSIVARMPSFTGSYPARRHGVLPVGGKTPFDEQGLPFQRQMHG